MQLGSQTDVGRCLAALLATVAVALVTVEPQVHAQVGLPWTGWMQCDVVAKAKGYQSRQTHTWQLTGAKGTQSGAIESRPATWSVSGDGWLQTGDAAQIWTATVAPTAAPISTLIRASDGQRLIQAGHAQLQAPNAIAINQTPSVVGSTAKPSLAVFEWAFPIVVDSPKSTTVKGSQTAPVTQRLDRMQPADASGSATCSWYFTVAGEAPPVPTPQPLDPPPFVTSSTVKPQPDAAATSAAATATGQGGAPVALGTAGAAQGQGIQSVANTAPTGAAGVGRATAADRSAGKREALQAKRSASIGLRLAPAFTTNSYSFAFRPPTGQWLVTLTNNGPDAADGTLVNVGDRDQLADLETVACFASGASCPATIGPASIMFGNRIGISSWPVAGTVWLLITKDIYTTNNPAYLFANVAAPPASDLTVTSTSSTGWEISTPVDQYAPRPTADLGVAVGVLVAAGGVEIDQGMATITVVATNHGPGAAHGATITMVPNYPAADLTCSTTGALCPGSATLTPARAQSGLVIPIWPANGSVSFRVHIGVSYGATRISSVGLRATVAAPSEVDDLQPANNTFAAGLPLQP